MSSENSSMLIAKPPSKLGFQWWLKLFLLAPIISMVIVFTITTIMLSEVHDFDVFYYSGRAALNGATIYDYFGKYALPYWYFPWLAWSYAPLAYLPHDTAFALYVAYSILLAAWSTHWALQRFIPRISRVEILFAFCMVLTISWLVFRTGQMDLILLAAALFAIYLIDRDKSQYAALLIPFFLFKPHLFILFIPAALLKGKRQFLISSILVFIALMILSFLIIPDWPQQMLQMLATNGQRTDHNSYNFTTLPNMLGLQENWSGTANLPITMLLIFLGGLAVWNVRELDTPAFLATSLAGSLFCAPRAYGYDFPLLVPALIWLASDLRESYRLPFWVVVAAFPFFFRFSSGAYLLVLAVFAASLAKAYYLKQRKTLKA